MKETVLYNIVLQHSAVQRDTAMQTKKGNYSYCTEEYILLTRNSDRHGIAPHGIASTFKKYILGQFVVRNLENHLNYIDFFLIQIRMI